jgi:DUF4097 and DUF4098 domain-containing protein YvlB
MKALTTTTALVLLVLSVAGIAAADRSVDETRPLAPDGRVEISNVAGEVTVVGWTGSGVAITGTLGDNVEELAVTSDGDHLSIEVELERKVRSSGEARLTVKVPIGASVEVETVSADITVDGVRGDLDLESVSGRVEVSGEPRSLAAASVSGDLVVASAAGRTELEAVSGKVVVGRASGRLEVSVVSGDIELEGGVLESLELETVSGTAVCRVAPAAGGRFAIETMSGRVELVLPAQVDADFHIETFSGSIENDFGPAPKRTDEYGPGRELRFTSGNGGARITVESFSGSVHLRTK